MDLRDGVAGRRGRLKIPRAQSRNAESSRGSVAVCSFHTGRRRCFADSLEPLDTKGALTEAPDPACAGNRGR